MNRRRGAALMLVLVMMGVAALFCAGVWTMLAQRVKSDTLRTRERDARVLAESGIEAAIAALRQDTQYAGCGETALGRGTYQVVVAAAPAGWRVESTGTVRDGALALGTYRVSASIVRGAQGFSITSWEGGKR